MKNVCKFSGKKSEEWTISKKQKQMTKQKEQAEKQEVR